MATNALVRAGVRLFKAARQANISGGKVTRLIGSQAKAQTNYDAAKVNRDARIQLAAIYRILAQQNLHEGVCNHLTLMAPAANGQGQIMLLVPYGLHWTEVTASSLVGLDENNEVVEGTGIGELSAACIHRGTRLDENPNKNCILHTHMPYATALGCLEDPTLKHIHQGSIRFYNRIAYDKDYDGYAIALQEGHRLSRLLGDKDVLIMCNHGVLVCGETPALAYDRLYYLERAAMYQILAMSSGRKLSEIPLDLILRARKDLYGEGTDAEMEFANIHMNAVLRTLKRDSPGFDN